MIFRCLTVLMFTLVGSMLHAQNCGTDLSDETGKDVVYCKSNGKGFWGEQLAQIGIGNYERSFALLVGVSDYDHYNDLNTKNDVKNMREYLMNDAGFDVVHVLSDRKATARRIQELMVDEFPAQMTSKDRFVFYWSGHGVTREGNNSQVGYLPLSNSKKGSYSQMIPMSDLEQWDDFIQSSQVLYLLDSCFSGLAGVQEKSEIEDINRSQMAKPSRHLMTAGTAGEETIVIDRLGGSLFTRALIDGMRGRADAGNFFGKDGLVSIGELKEYVSTRMEDERRKIGWKKTITPQLQSMAYSEGAFFFVVPDGKIEDEINKAKDEVIKLEPKVSSADISFVIETLSALGYRVGDSGDELDLQTRRALLQFQLDSGLETTGTLNEPTKIALISSGLRAQAKGDEADVERLMAIDQERLAALERNNLARKAGVKTSSDCDECPDMILIDGGNLSTTITAKGPKYADVVNFDIGQFSVSQTEVTNQQFLAFATDQGIEEKFFNRSCYMWNQSTPPSMVATKTDADFYLENPNDPASCISLKEARDYVSWLSEKTSTVGKYRLPTEIEFEYLLTAGNAGRTPCKDFNGADASTKFTWRYDDCADLYPRKAPVASFSPNDFGVYDLFGNLWEWTGSCWVEDISNSNCESSKIYTVRGASFDDSPYKFKSKSRQPVPISRLQQNIGFRVVKEVQ